MGRDEQTIVLDAGPVIGLGRIDRVIAEVLLLRTTFVRSGNTSRGDYGAIVVLDVLVGTVSPVDAFWTRSK